MGDVYFVSYFSWYKEKMDDVAIHESTIAIKDSKVRTRKLLHW